MPIKSKTIPQKSVEYKTVTILDILELLPDTIPFNKTVIVGGQLALYGKTIENVVFYFVQNEQVSGEQLVYFDNILSPLGIHATASNLWRNQEKRAIRLYTDGRLIIDKKTGIYKELPMPISQVPILTIEEFMSKAPKTIPWKQTILLVGGLMKKGWSGHDADVMPEDPSFPKEELPKLANFIGQAVGWRVDAGVNYMHDREPIYTAPLYENGKLNESLWQSTT